MKRLLILAIAVFCISLIAEQASAHGPQQFRGRSSFRSNNFRSFRSPGISLNFGGNRFRRDDDFNDGFRAGLRASQQQQFRQFQFRGHHN